VSDIHEIHDGIEVRRLGLMEQPEHTLKYAWPVMAGPDGSPDPIPQADWKPVDLSPLVLSIEDQNGVGMCAASGTANTASISRAIAGLGYVKLSAGDLYNRVCGGTDRGSLPEDCLSELLNEGIAPVSVNPYLSWRSTRATAADRAPFKGLEAWRCPTASHVATALQMGFPVLIGYLHHDRDEVDRDGWLSNPRGGAGGHAVCAVGLVQRNGQWGIKYENSWTAQWGVNGFGILPLARVEEGCRMFQAWALRSVVAEGTGLPPLKV